MILHNSAPKSLSDPTTKAAFSSFPQYVMSSLYPVVLPNFLLFWIILRHVLYCSYSSCIQTVCWFNFLMYHLWNKFRGYKKKGKPARDPHKNCSNDNQQNMEMDGNQLNAQVRRLPSWKNVAMHAFYIGELSISLSLLTSIDQVNTPSALHYLAFAVFFHDVSLFQYLL